MKQYFSIKYLPKLTLVAGGLGFLLRLWLINAENSRGFLPRWHISAILLYLLTLSVMVGLILATRYLQQGNKYSFNFPANTTGAIGTLCCCFAFAVTGIVDLIHHTDGFSTCIGLLAIIAALALSQVATARWKGEHPSALWHIIVCVYLIFRVFFMYRSWRTNPQLLDFCFQLLALICMLLSVYHRATFDEDMGNRGRYTFFSCMALYFCCLCVTGDENIPFFLGSGIWMYTNQCALSPMPKQYWEKQS